MNNTEITKHEKNGYVLRELLDPHPINLTEDQGNYMGGVGDKCPRSIRR